MSALVTIACHGELGLLAVEVITPRELDDSLEQAWRHLQAADPDLRSPFFVPEFCRVVGAVRDDTRIAVISDPSGPVGFFPFHRQRFGRLAPLAGQISDYHGIVGTPAATAGFAAVLRQAGAHAYDFNHAPASQALFLGQAFHTTHSPLVDLTEGFEPWRLAQRAKVRALREVERRGRKLAREVGPLRFVANDTSDQVWQAMLDWKRRALAAKGVGFILDTGWPREIAETIRHSDGPGFAGLTSALWAGDELVAVHFGMRTQTTAHWWFPTFNEEFGRYTPGLTLLFQALENAEQSGIKEFDFGRGSERYKTEFANARRVLCEGSVERPLHPLGAIRRLRKGMQRLLARSRASAMTDITRRAGNRLFSAGRLS